MIHNGNGLHLTDDERSARGAREAAELRDFQEREAELRRITPFGGGAWMDDPGKRARDNKLAKQSKADADRDQFLALPTLGLDMAIARRCSDETALDSIIANNNATGVEAHDAKTNAAQAASETEQLRFGKELAQKVAVDSIRANKPVDIDPATFAPKIEAADRRAAVLAVLAQEKAVAFHRSAQHIAGAKAHLEAARSDERWARWALVVRPLVDAFAAAARDTLHLLTPEEQVLARQRIVHVITRGVAT